MASQFPPKIEEMRIKPLAVVTGASSGIGYELAKVFAKNGYDLLVCSEDPGLVEAADSFRVLGADVEMVQADLATHEGVDQLWSKIKISQKPIDCVALNAGVGVGGEFHETNLQAELNMIQLNVTSVVHLTKHLVPFMMKQGHGRLLFTSSLAATMPGPYYAVYAATKAFVQSFAEAIRFEVKDKGIVVTALQPGATDTNFFARAGMMDTKAGQGKKDSAAQVAQEGFEALMNNEDHVVAGSIVNAVQAKMANMMTDPQGAAAQAKSTKPNSKN